MGDFVIYPAIDLRFGKVVRLKQGKADRQTVYSSEPATTAKTWAAQGARWLHVVNLNGAFGEETRENEAAIGAILASVPEGLNIQMGGGIRTLAHIDKALSLGVTRVVIGTAVIENPDFGIEVLNEFGGEKVAFGFDAVDQVLMTEGWQTDSGLSMMTLGKKFADVGAKTVIYTNIRKDGMQTGVDWENAKMLSDQTGLTVIASGGTTDLQDIWAVHKAGLGGVIIGRALYERNFTLKEALNVR